MQVVVAVDREDDRDDARGDRPDRRAAPSEFGGRRSDQVATQHDVTPVDEDRHRPDEQGAVASELRTRLHHLRKPEVGALRRVRRHRDGAEDRAERERDQGPDQVESEPDADRTGGERQQLGASGEPDGRLIEQLALAFADRHVVDRSGLDSTDGSRRGCLGRASGGTGGHRVSILGEHGSVSAELAALTLRDSFSDPPLSACTNFGGLSIRMYEGRRRCRIIRSSRSRKKGRR